VAVGSMQLAGDITGTSFKVIKFKVPNGNGLRSILPIVIANFISYKIISPRKM